MHRLIHQLPTTLAGMVICAVLLPVLWHQMQAWRSYQRQLRQEDYGRVLGALESGRIAADTPVSDYLRIGSPVTVRECGPFTKYEHGFPGGPGHAVVLLARGNKLLLAYNSSCMGHKEHFNVVTSAEQQEWLKWYE
jgi:hypothetical protein